MYQHLLISFLLAAAPAASPQATSTQQPAAGSATGSTQKPTSGSAAGSGSASGTAQKPAAGSATTKPGAAAAKGVRTIEIVGTDDMKFSLTNITAKPGEQLRVRLVTKSAMPKIAMAHNFVLLQKASNPVEFATAAMNARATDFIPPDRKGDIVANTALAGGGETVETTFKVPAAAGDYPYLCSFPGHFQAGMRGTLTVK